MTDLSQIAEQEWNEANRRAIVVRPLIEFEHCPREKARVRRKGQRKGQGLPFAF